MMKPNFDTNQVKFEFGFQMSTNQFYKIMHISQTIHRIELEFYREKQYTWKYIVVNGQVK
jgi:hypothetical protein